MTAKQEPLNVDVPLKDQTRECLIALVEAMDKQAKENEARAAALKNLSKTTCAHCQEPHKGMWLECGNCFRIRGALEDLFHAMARAELVAEDSLSADEAVVESIKVVRTKMTACRNAGIGKLVLAPTPKDNPKTHGFMHPKPHGFTH